MTSAERAARLHAIDDEAEKVRAEEYVIAAKRRYGIWRWQFVGGEIHMRSRTLPTLPLDMLRSEASDLMHALSRALGEKLPKQPRVTKTQRRADGVTRRKWNKRNHLERQHALKVLADEFRESGGWR